VVDLGNLGKTGFDYVLFITTYKLISILLSWQSHAIIIDYTDHYKEFSNCISVTL